MYFGKKKNIYIYLTSILFKTETLNCAEETFNFKSYLKNKDLTDLFRLTIQKMLCS